jgi:hypothetical protein
MPDGRHLLVTGDGFGNDSGERSWIVDPFHPGSDLLAGARSLGRTAGGLPAPDGKTLYAEHQAGVSMDKKSVVRVTIAAGRVVEVLTRWATVREVGWPSTELAGTSCSCATVRSCG